jgi:DNA invertase Pin-like site-specific DNA recombinase|tara:strand:+ start:3646 stop:3960 length:315 start_codon:yes stop_codon:yes gene_type:complete
MAKVKRSYKLDKEIIERLALIMCSYEEIAMVMETSVDNLKKRYKEVIDKGRAEGKKGLRRAQYEKAVKDKDVRMLIFLGKNYLDQKDQPSETESNEPLPWPEDA